MGNRQGKDRDVRRDQWKFGRLGPLGRHVFLYGDGIRIVDLKTPPVDGRYPSLLH